MQLRAAVDPGGATPKIFDDLTTTKVNLPFWSQRSEAVLHWLFARDFSPSAEFTVDQGN